MSTDLEPAACPPQMVENGACQGSFCSIPEVRMNVGETLEGCWVRPNTLCGASDSDEDKYSGKPYPGDDPYQNAYYSTGPCNDPDPRSDVVTEGVSLGLAFIVLTFV